jgi:hypothetical protein
MMRAWGRVYQPSFKGQGHSDNNELPLDDLRKYYWTAVTTDSNTGDNTNVYFLNLIQVLLLNLNESPFYANYGIPAQISVIQQIHPDIFVQLTVQQFARYFASLAVITIPDIKPHYRINALALNGAVLSRDVVI